MSTQGSLIPGSDTREMLTLPTISRRIRQKPGFILLKNGFGVRKCYASRQVFISARCYSRLQNGGPEQKVYTQSARVAQASVMNSNELDLTLE